ncbi:MAG: SSU rRNA (adenine(1518)-N(6)/adenine(1519)-N(6))-dimethyltransferase [Ignavibacteriae bacterium]|nr:MAG: SSU rRNA (adenine(1518)-N(6)/adenine(1519)-N(6))-dimethyltransferase [Ignavibacteriota bacterium]
MHSPLKVNTGRILIKAKRALGQNFLIDENIARKIVNSANLSSKDIVIEIGPGQGALTKYIVENTKRLYAIEIDKRVIDILKENFPQKNVIFINEDFLELDIQKIFEKEKRKIKLIGNIPYNITSQILFKAIDNRAYLENCTFMVQKEVAQRIIAKSKTKDYGILSVITQYYGKPEILFKVSPNCFFPKPKVTSAVIKIDFIQTYQHKVEDELFRTLVRTAFGKRRKTLNNSLKYLPFYDEISQRLKNFKKFSLDKRAEELTVDDFIDFAKFISA